MSVEAFAAAPAPSGLEALLTLDQGVLEAIPTAVYVCSADGVIVRYNGRAAELWGRSPRVGDTDERFCGSFRLYRPDGTLLPHADTPMAAVVRLSGPPIRLNPRCALTLGMAIHELATNAAKYGALSIKEGAVDVAWQADFRDRRLRMRWSEGGGPAVAPPGRSGFGRLLLERALASDLRGEVCLDFAERGLQCEIVVPLDGHLAGLH